MNLQLLLKRAHSGLLPACKNCPWSPKNIEQPAFGVSCQIHGVDWSISNSAVSIQIAQDPAGTTPETTGRLCNVCNSENPTDRSAQHGNDLWNATVPLFPPGQPVIDFRKQHYWTNATLHGLKDGQAEAARVCCTKVLLEQINILSPQIIIAVGEFATKSLFDLGFISQRWQDFKDLLAKQAYSEIKVLPSGKKVTVFCSYQSALRVVNTHLARRYSGETEVLISRKLKKLPDTGPVSKFLRKYPKSVTEGQGMRILLLHWLEIGASIRAAYSSFGTSY